MPDNTLQFETRVDLSGLNSGMDAAKARVSSFGGDVKSAMVAAAAATKQLADAQIQLGSAAEQGNSNAAAIIQEYQRSVDEANDAVRSFTATQVEETSAVRAGTSARMAASAELRIFEGNIQGSTRAAAAFLASLPGIGAAMQVAFPVFGAIALLEVLGQMVGAIHNVVTAYEQMGEAARDAAIAQAEAASRGKETVKPDVGFTEGVARIGRMISGNSDSPNAVKSITGSDTTVQTVSGLQRQLQMQDALLKSQGQLDEAGLKTSALAKQKQSDIQKEIDLRQKQINATTDLEYADQQLIKNADSSQAQVKIAASEITNAENLRQSLNNQIDVLQNQKAAEGKIAAEPAKTPQINRIQLLIEEQNQEKQIYAQFHEYLQALMLDDIRAQTEAYHKQEQADRERTELFKKNQADMRTSAQESAQSTHDTSIGGIQTAEVKVHAGQALGITDPTKDLQALQQLHAQALAEDEKFLQQEIAIYADEPQKVAQYQKQLEQTINKGNQQQLQDTEKILQQQEQKYKTTYQAITQDFNQAINKMITTGESPAKAFAQMLDQMLGQLATFIATFLEKKAEMWVLDQVLTKTSQTATATAQITANAAVAATGAIAATAAIPVVGPALAPAAGAAMFAQTISYLGLAAFEQGGIVGGASGMPVPIMAHAGERVLTAGQTNKFESMVNNGGNSSSNVNLHYNPQINGIDKSGMRSILQSHADDIHAIVRSGVRSGAIGARG